MRMLPHRAEDQDEKVRFTTPFKNNVTSFCGHKIDIEREPRTNCEQCWAFYFMQNHEFTQMLSQQYLKGNEQKQALVNKYGTKLVKRLEAFLVTVVKAREVQEIMDRELLSFKEQDVVVSTNGIEGGFDGNTAEDIF